MKRWLIDLNELSGNIKIETKLNNISKLDQSPEIDWKITGKPIVSEKDGLLPKFEDIVKEINF